MATPLRVQLSLKKGADHRQPPASLAARTTVVIVSYNASRTIRECLSSIVASEPDADVIVVDNASTDDTARLVSQEFPRVRLVRNDGNTGFGGGNNLGAAQSEAFGRTEDVAAIWGAAFAARRQVFEALEGFDPASFL